MSIRDKLANRISGGELNLLRERLMLKGAELTAQESGLRKLVRENIELTRLANHLRREAEVQKDRADLAVKASDQWRAVARHAEEKTVRVTLRADGHEAILKTIAEIPVHIRSNGTVRRLVRLAKERLS